MARDEEDRRGISAHPRRMMLNLATAESVVTSMVPPGPTADGAAEMTGRVARDPSAGFSRFGGVKICPSKWLALRTCTTSGGLWCGGRGDACRWLNPHQAESNDQLHPAQWPHATARMLLAQARKPAPELHSASIACSHASRVCTRHICQCPNSTRLAGTQQQLALQGVQQPHDNRVGTQAT